MDVDGDSSRRLADSNGDGSILRSASHDEFHMDFLGCSTFSLPIWKEFDRSSPKTAKGGRLSQLAGRMQAPVFMVQCQYGMTARFAPCCAKLICISVVHVARRNCTYIRKKLIRTFSEIPEPCLENTSSKILKS
jgi:hypothetical protein